MPLTVTREGQRRESEIRDMKREEYQMTQTLKMACVCARKRVCVYGVAAKVDSWRMDC